jgi:hypothetical protein
MPFQRCFSYLSLIEVGWFLVSVGYHSAADFRVPWPGERNRHTTPRAKRCSRRRLDRCPLCSDHLIRILTLTIRWLGSSNLNSLIAEKQEYEVCW